VIVIANRTKKINLHFMVDEAERELIERRMAQAGIKSLRAYLLKMAIDGHVIQLDLASVKEMVRLLSNATNNINQIARRVNENGSVYAADIEELQSRYEGLWEQAGVILRKLSKL